MGDLRDMPAEELLKMFWNIATEYGRESNKKLPCDPNELRAELLRRLGASGVDVAACTCVCHKVGLLGFMCCACSIAVLQSFVQVKSDPVETAPEAGPSGENNG